MTGVKIGETLKEAKLRVKLEEAQATIIDLRKQLIDLEVELSDMELERDELRAELLAVS